MLQLQPFGIGPFVQAQAHGGVQRIISSVEHLITRPALDPAIGVLSVDLGEHTLLCGELFVPFTRQLLAGVHVAGAGFVDGELAQQQVFGAVHAHQPELDAVRYLAAAVVDLLRAAGADDVALVVVVALDGAQAGVWRFLNSRRLGAALCFALAAPTGKLHKALNPLTHCSPCLNPTACLPFFAWV